MGEVVSLDSQRPHLAGDAYCLGCQHRWVSVSPVGVVDDLECPNCHSMKGRYLKEVQVEEEHWACMCGNRYFSITPNRIYCGNCGQEHRFT